MTPLQHQPLAIVLGALMFGLSAAPALAHDGPGRGARERAAEDLRPAHLRGGELGFVYRLPHLYWYGHYPLRLHGDGHHHERRHHHRHRHDHRHFKRHGERPHYGGGRRSHSHGWQQPRRDRW